jgi:arylsulfatase A-like enzyme
MPGAWRARVLPAVGKGATAGVVIAGGLLVGEASSAALAGAGLPPRAWLLFALYYVPGLAGAGAFIAAGWPRGADRPALFPGLLAAGVAFTYLVAVTSQDFLRGRGAGPRAAAALLAGGLVIAAAWAGRARPPRPVALAAATAVFVVVLDAAARLLREAPRPLAVAVLPPLALVAALAVIRSALRWPRLDAALLVALTFVAAAGAAIPRSYGRVVDRPPPPPPEQPRPNVVLIVLDTVRADSLSSYGYARRTTPRLDEFAAGAVRHTAATSVSPWSVPSHASLFTGLLPAEHGAGRGLRDAHGDLGPAPLASGPVTLAEALTSRGYATAAISANILVAAHLDLLQGFAYADVRRARDSLHAPRSPLLLRARNLVPRRALADHLQPWFPRAFRGAGEITDAAIEWLRRPRAAGQPYFLFLNYMDAHTPFVARPGFYDRWPGRSPRLPSFGLATAGEILSGERAITAEEADHLRALYDAGLSYLDHEAGRLLDFIDARPEAGRTLVVVTADHGEALGERGRLGHDCVLSREVLHVPLIVRHPREGGGATVAQPAVDARPIQTVDVTRLILEAAGAPLPPAPSRPQGAMVAEVDCYCAPQHPRFHGTSAAAMVRDGIGLVHEEGRPPLPFDLGEPGAPAAGRASAVEELSVALAEWHKARPAAPPVVDPGANAEREEALRALGYVK